MHGTIFYELQKYLENIRDKESWQEVVTDAGVGGRYSALNAYPDEEAVSLIVSAARIMKLDPDKFQQSFGRYLAGRLIASHQMLLESDWDALDLIENTERVIHEVVRARDTNAAPPHLECHRESPTEVRIVYRSKRHLCSLMQGMAEGIGDHYGQRLRTVETSCMKFGASFCEVTVSA